MSFVSVIIGSKTDWQVMQECIKVLDSFGVKNEILISSAHRTPKRTYDHVQDALKRGAEVFIGAAGMAAHLAGFIAAHTCKPVIAVPLGGGALDGLDALLSSVQMPKTMPVATVSLGKAGAINAAYLAMQILALKDKDLESKLIKDREQKAKALEMDSKELELEVKKLREARG
ncbi:5-(carboxyamino)imidazole ribonucleotide mutase [Helicobacter sp. 11S02629-2]|uniref:5-(carboxyamino)imidazole ribonucleotide mutase n=1 Tax=Helicobacter sp. 11S02629-2 TaxID=1476195 RepID=UPI000BA53CBE|nr:5-(carboxyamino)imidazole ribonucleotide mutase [Helicobacter sp. 11S02629-2]PAF44380.1 5-(carboxyamino)imidazole ribonucleotide mutase [Helicobacter sp. 11S02629-2]